MQDLLKNAGQRALEYAMKYNVQAEVYASSQREMQIEAASHQVATLKEASESGLAVRVLNGGRLGFAYTSDLKPDALHEAVDAAIAVSKFMPVDEHLQLTPAGLAYPQMDTYDDDIGQRTVKEKISLVFEAEAIAQGTDRRIAVIERSVFEEKESRLAICNSLGLDVYGQGNYCSLYLYAVAREDGDAQGGFGSMSRRRYDELDARQVGNEAAQRALRSLKARSMASATLPCVLEPYVAVKFLGLLARMVDGEAVLKGKSLLGDKLGRNVAADCLTVVDDATLSGGLATFPFDDEGVPAQKQTLIEKGGLKGFLYNNQAAHRAGADSTGHAQRMSYRSLPSISPSNLTISAGNVNDKDMLGVAKGLYVTDLMGLHTANPVSGDFSLGASGMLIENGRLSYPVRGMVVAGNMIQLLQDIEAVGNKLRFYGSRGAPSLRVSALSIAGD